MGETLVRKLIFNEDQAWHPMFLPKVLLDEKTSVAYSAVTLASELCQDVKLPRTQNQEIWTPSDQDILPAQGEVSAHDVPLPHNFDATTIWMNTLASDISLMEHMVESLINLCEQVFNFPYKRPEDASFHGEDTWDAIKYLQSLNEALLLQTRELQRAVHIRMTIINTFIAQRDNTANRNDSTAMMSIAFVTMFFLPGTSVAALFAMPFFDWAAGLPSPSDSVVNPRISIYVAVTILLTAIVLLLWRFLTHGTGSEHPPDKESRYKKLMKAIGWEGTLPEKPPTPQIAVRSATIEGSATGRPPRGVYSPRADGAHVVIRAPRDGASPRVVDSPGVNGSPRVIRAAPIFFDSPTGDGESPNVFHTAPVVGSPLRYSVNANDDIRPFRGPTGTAPGNPSARQPRPGPKRRAHFAPATADGPSLPGGVSSRLSPVFETDQTTLTPPSYLPGDGYSGF